MSIRLITVLVLILGAFIAPWWSVALGIILCVMRIKKDLIGINLAHDFLFEWSKDEHGRE